MSKCIECQHVELDDKMSKLGFSKCKSKNNKLAIVGGYFSLRYERNCENFESVDEETIGKRWPYIKNLISRNLERKNY